MSLELKQLLKKAEFNSMPLGLDPNWIYPTVDFKFPDRQSLDRAADLLAGNKFVGQQIVTAVLLESNILRITITPLFIEQYGSSLRIRNQEDKKHIREHANADRDEHKRITTGNLLHDFLSLLRTYADSIPAGSGGVRTGSITEKGIEWYIDSNDDISGFNQAFKQFMSEAGYTSVEIAGDNSQVTFNPKAPDATGAYSTQGGRFLTECYELVHMNWEREEYFKSLARHVLRFRSKENAVGAA